MSYEQVVIFVAIVAAAGYFQTVTGFGFGMIILGAMTGLGYLPISVTAAIVNLLAVINCATALPGRLNHFDVRMVSWILAGLLPAIPAGLLLLAFLSADAANLLQGLLGILVAYGGISVVWRTGSKVSKSPNWSFLLAGTGSGLCGGLFGASGPPLIYQLYRQPIALVSIRNMLFFMFAVTSSTRAFILAVTGQLDTVILELAAIALPTVVLATFLGRRLPPPLSPRVMRGVVCVMLVGIGGQLLGSSIWS